jgi:hypothetical protein
MDWATLLGRFIGEAIRPILAEEIDRAIKNAFRNTAEISTPAPDLQRLWIDGLPQSDNNPARRGGPTQPAG